MKFVDPTAWPGLPPHIRRILLEEMYGPYKYTDINDKIKFIVNKTLNVNVDKKTNKREVADARHIVRYFIKKHTKWSLEKIGFITCKANHATVISSIRTVKSLMHIKGDFREKFLKCQALISDMVYEFQKNQKQR